jgi:tRNA A37 threonylcarbamoyladenosine synthetase subunit TsaC/SUA5/YrdC
LLSCDNKKLSLIKQRPINQKILYEVDCFKTLLKHTRVPSKYRKKVRNSNLTTFIYPNSKSYRVVDKNHKHYNFLNKFKIIHSTSANITTKEFNKDWAIKNSDIIVEDKNGFNENQSSKIYKITQKKIKKIR